MAELHDILLRPLITEKTSVLMARENTFSFEVGERSNKHQIKAAVETLYGVKVAEVRTARVRGKTKRFGRFQGKRSNWKKAYVKLIDGDTINFYGA
jgi:large subunit ribosomal protein L23